MDPENALNADLDDHDPSAPYADQRRLSRSPDMAAAVQQMPQPLFPPPTSSPTTPSQPGATKRYRPAPAKTFQCRGYGECRMVFSRSEHLARHIRYVSPPLFFFFFFSAAFMPLRDKAPPTWHAASATSVAVCARVGAAGGGGRVPTRCGDDSAPVAFSTTSLSRARRCHSTPPARPLSLYAPAALLLAAVGSYPLGVATTLQGPHRFFRPPPSYRSRPTALSRFLFFDAFVACR